MMLYYYILIFISGTCLGSFYNVVGLRKAKNESIVFPASHCPKCNHELKWYELIPVFSYIFLKGRCLKCHKKISIQYPLIELLTGILFTFAFYKFGFTISFLVSLVIISALIIIYITDFKEYIILDEVIVCGSIAIIILKYLEFGAKETLISLITGVSLFLLMYLIKLFGDKVFKRESLGGGDIKLSFLIGLTVELRLSLVVLIVASFLAFPYAIIVSNLKKKSEVPYGPFLITALLIVYFKSDFFLEILSMLVK